MQITRALSLVIALGVMLTVSGIGLFILGACNGEATFTLCRFQGNGLTMALYAVGGTALGAGIVTLGLFRVRTLPATIRS